VAGASDWAFAIARGVSGFSAFTGCMYDDVKAGYSSTWKTGGCRCDVGAQLVKATYKGIQVSIQRLNVPCKEAIKEKLENIKNQTEKPLMGIIAIDVITGTGWKHNYR
jgi:hypothetical protein